MQRSPASHVLILLLASVGGACVLACAEDAARTPTAPSGARVYAAQGCALCHGSDATGSSLGPTLHGKAAFWTREKLIEYLKAPVAYAEKDARLSRQKKKYSLPMSQFDKVPEDELGLVADFVLHLP